MLFPTRKRLVGWGGFESLRSLQFNGFGYRFLHSLLCFRGGIPERLLKTGPAFSGELSSWPYKNEAISRTGRKTRRPRHDLPALSWVARSGLACDQTV